MQICIYKDKLLQALKTKDPGLRDMVLQGLQENRAQFLREAATILVQSGGQLRLALLGVMIEDGGKDLIPIFSTFAAREANVLFAKSLVMLMAQFDHFEALTALRELQPNLRSEVKTAAGRAMGKLNGKFREQFYMDEFRAGISNPKRIKHAADTMLSHPHPMYIPFLNEIILDKDTTYREPGVMVLEKLADLTSVDPLKTLLDMLVQEAMRNDLLCDYLLSETTNSLSEFLQRLGHLAGWEPGLAEELTAEILSKNIRTTLEWYAHSFGPFPKMLADGLMPFVKQQLLKGKVDKTTKERLAATYSANRDSRTQMIAAISKTLGRLGRENQIEGLGDAFDQLIPVDFPARSSFHISLLSGYRTPEAVAQLSQYLGETDDVALQQEIIEALSQCDVRKQPPVLFDMVLNSSSDNLRTAALNLLAKTRPTEEQLKTLLNQDNESRRQEARAMIAEHGLEAGYELLIQQLEAAELPEAQIILIEALRAFPRGHTGSAVLNFFIQPYERKVRKAALTTMIHAGGPKRTALVFAALGKLQAEEYGLGVTMMISIMEPLRTDALPPDILVDSSLWATLLNSKNGRFRDGTLAILARSDWSKSKDPKWLKTLEDALANKSVVRSDGERGRFGNIRQWVQAHSGSKDQNSKFRTELMMLMETIENASQYDKFCALRKLNIIYREELIEPQDKNRLVYQMTNYFQQSEGDSSGLKLAISIAAKVNDPQLMDEVVKLEQNEDVDLARFARKARDMALKKAGQVREVQSILVVDSTAMMAKNLSRALNRVGYEVITATEPREALRAMQKQPFDLLLTSYRLGEVTGVQLYKEAKHHHIAPQRLMFLTSSRDEEEQKEMQVAGADAILLKPFPMDALYQKIKDMSETSEQVPAGH